MKLDNAIFNYPITQFHNHPISLTTPGMRWH